ncbi:hypothetical protein SJI19_23240 [Acerihabitans sp. TG2]|nr:hypothetical protein [Acerihabitans sp. TG2]MEA9393411.1 hypothetical protein [Acerihabitans sp. TG2]
MAKVCAGALASFSSLRFSAGSRPQASLMFVGFFEQFSVVDGAIL